MTLKFYREDRTGFLVVDDEAPSADERACQGRCATKAWEPTSAAIMYVSVWFLEQFCTPVKQAEVPAEWLAALAPKEVS